MKYTAPTYEEYLKATKFAKLRYRYGVYIQIISAVLLIYLLYYTITNIEEMKAEPVAYAEKTRGVTCFNSLTNIAQPNQNGISRDIKNIEQG